MFIESQQHGCDDVSFRCSLEWVRRRRLQTSCATKDLPRYACIVRSPQSATAPSPLPIRAGKLGILCRCTLEVARLGLPGAVRCNLTIDHEGIKNIELPSLLQPRIHGTEEGQVKQSQQCQQLQA